MKRYILTSGKKNKLSYDKQPNESIQLGGGGDFNEKFVFPYPEYDTKAKRLKKLDELKKKLKGKKEFKGRIYVIGYGAVGRPLLVMLFELINIKPENVTLIDDRWFLLMRQYQKVLI